MTTAVLIEGVSKQYRLGQVGTGTITHDLNRWWARIRGKQDPFALVGQVNDRSLASTKPSDSEYVWALKDINLRVEQGQILGVIGRNGAGKSTLLKLLSRVTAPTTGTIRVRGRMASLLEVGTGFHPDLTGRENIFLNGAILGMTRAEIRKRFDEIVEFSGCAKYIDTPVKRYSSGMYVRLAFAVAAHLEPEILIVDEVLAVGDADFQARCIGKMEDVSRNSGRTILFVSHNMASIRRLCSQSALLKNGTLVECGPTDQIIDNYLAMGTEAKRTLLFPNTQKPERDGIRLDSISVSDSDGGIDSRLSTSDVVNIQVQYTILSPVRNLRIALGLYSQDGSHVLSSSDFNSQTSDRCRMPGTYVSTIRIPSFFLNVGKYVAAVDLDIPCVAGIHADYRVEFNIDDLAENFLGITISPRPPGAIHPRMEWSINAAPLSVVPTDQLA